MNNINFLHDQHVHTSYSEDSNASMEEYIKIAISKGCSYFIMTDHLDFDIPMYKVNWIADYKKEREEIDRLQEKYKNKITILQGIECGYRVGYEDDILKILNDNRFDLINLSIHNYLDLDFYYKEDFLKIGIKKMVSLYFEAIIKAINSNIDFDVFSHIDYAFKTARTLDNNLQISTFESQLKIIFNLLIKKEKCLEINTKVQEAINDESHIKYLLNLYYSLGGRDLTLSSDAHVENRYLSSFDHYKEIIKECNFKYLCYFINRKKYKFYI